MEFFVCLYERTLNALHYILNRYCLMVILNNMYQANCNASYEYCLMVIFNNIYQANDNASNELEHGQSETQTAR